MKPYAVKTIVKSMLEITDKETFKDELEFLRGLDHPYIIKFYESYSDEKFFHFVLEYCSGGELVSKII
jgi:calcium-dependent protein kinase